MFEETKYVEDDVVDSSAQRLSVWTMHVHWNSEVLTRFIQILVLNERILALTVAKFFLRHHACF